VLLRPHGVTSLRHSWPLRSSFQSALTADWHVDAAHYAAIHFRKRKIIRAGGWSEAGIRVDVFPQCLSVQCYA